MRFPIPLVPLLLALPVLGQGLPPESNRIQIHARGMVHGRVSAPNGEPVPGAAVELRPLRAGARAHRLTTDAKGRFSGTGLDAFRYRLTATAPGFLPSKPRTVKVPAGEHTVCDITLVPSAGEASPKGQDKG